MTGRAGRTLRVLSPLLPQGHAALRWVFLGAALCGCFRQAGAGKLDAPRPLSVRWRAELRDALESRWKPEEAATPVVAGDLVIVGVRTRGVFALDRRSGQVRWHALPSGADGPALFLPDPPGKEEAGLAARTDRMTWLGRLLGAPARPPAAARGTLYLGSNDGCLYALDAATGRVRWRFPKDSTMKGTMEHAPIHRDGVLYFTTSENRLYAVTAVEGRWKWQYERESPEHFTIRGFAGPALVGKNVCTGFSDGYVACVAAESGEVQWARSLAAVSDQFVDVDSTPVFHQGLLFAASYSGGVYALGPNDGAVVWRFHAEGAGGIIPADERLFFSTGTQGLHAIDLKGRLVWRQAVESAGAFGTPVLGPEGSLVVGSADGGLFVVARDSGHLRALFAPGRGFSAPPDVEGHDVYALSNGGSLYALEL